MYTEFWWGNLLENFHTHTQDKEADGRLTLEWILGCEDRR
jgi:hypothetical protein